MIRVPHSNGLSFLKLQVKRMVTTLIWWVAISRQNSKKHAREDEQELNDKTGLLGSTLLSLGFCTSPDILCRQLKDGDVSISNNRKQGLWWELLVTLATVFTNFSKRRILKLILKTHDVLLAIVTNNYTHIGSIMNFLHSHSIVEFGQVPSNLFVMIFRFWVKQSYLPSKTIANSYPWWAAYSFIHLICIKNLLHTRHHTRYMRQWRKTIQNF